MSRRKTTTKKRPTKVKPVTVDAQAELITACVVFAQARSACSAGYKADPDGNSKNAERLSEPYYRKATLALASVALSPASTIEALRAKSAVAEILVEEMQDCGCRTDKLDALFLTQFAKDVNGFARLAIEEKWKAESAAKNAAKNAA